MTQHNYSNESVKKGNAVARAMKHGNLTLEI